MSTSFCPSDHTIVLDVTAGPICSAARFSALAACSTTYVACQAATLGLDYHNCASTYNRCVTNGWDTTERCFVSAWEVAGCQDVKPVPVPSRLLQPV